MIQPGQYNIVIQRNGDYDITFQLKNTTDIPYDLTNHTVEAQLWTTGRRAKLTDFNVTMVDAVIGKIKLSLSDTVTADLPDSAYYDVRVTDNGGNSYYWVRGTATIEMGYTV